MQKLGDVVRTAQGLAVVRTPGEEYPDLGTEVVDEQLDAVGRVVDVFGPVDRPYLAVSPSEDVALASLVGLKLYAR
ncbi:H/ACA ribonucleoprotein complex subunit GAR1 [Halomicrococcus sp. NG-SE-24]|uniref:H/ACA ribonucleoprotein complex subunit GAR1 n=1 Tax=Halomicrococcus sp. NG-SE-24 TaxID=3436928 RepID=UPI003D991964